MRLISLNAENFKRLRTAFLPFKPGVNRITGKNKQGKSSALDALAALIGGERLCPEVPIRRGEDHAEVTADLGDYVVTRKWGKGAGLELKSKDGVPQKSPQTILDRISKRAFDPYEFFRMDAGDQFEVLRKLVGIDFTELDKKRADIYGARTLVNRDVEQIKGAIARMAVVNAPDEYIDVKALLEEQDKLLAEQRRSMALENAAKEATRKRETAQRRVEDTKGAIAELERQLASARGRLIGEEQAVIAALNAEETAENATFEPPDTDDVRRRLQEAEGINASVRAKKARAAEGEKLLAKEQESKKLTKQIEAIDGEKAKKLAAAKFPVPGLSLGDNRTPTLNGLPLDQASSAEQWQVAIAMGIARNPELRLFWVKDGSLLDDESLALLAAEVEKADAQVIIESVSHDGKDSGVGIFISDGEVVAVDGVPVSSNA